MFYDRFKNLCNMYGETPNSVCMKLGLSQAAAPYWKKSGKTPKRETLEMIAKYFGCSIEYLLGRNMTANEVFSSLDNDSYVQKEIAPARFSRSEIFSILSQLSDDELDNLLDYAKFLLSKRQIQVEQVNQ